MRVTLLAISVTSTIGVIGGAIATFFGGWSEALTFLVSLIVIDYLLGILIANVFHKSPKTCNGGASSAVGLQGICKKAVIMLIVYISYMLDKVSGSTFIKDATVIALIVNELTSIIENLGIMGVPLPSVITKAIDVLKNRDDKNV
jgi:toxin secretion/phage lysis holin